MIAVDTNLLVYATQHGVPLHHLAFDLLKELAEGHRPWAIPAHCLVEYTAIVTNRRIFSPPANFPDAMRQIQNWMKSPSVRILSENGQFWDHYADIGMAANASGGHLHDVRIAAVCRAHGVTEIWTTDRNFSRFPGLLIRNPL
jgi:uncharacterized protein